MTDKECTQIRIKAELSSAEGSKYPDCGKLLARMIAALREDFPRVISIERERTGEGLLGFGVSLGAEVKHE